MKVSVHYFGLIADKTGKSTETIEFVEPEGTTLDLRIIFENRFPFLKGTNYKIAVNQVICESILINKSQVEIALLPPFAGG